MFFPRITIKKPISHVHRSVFWHCILKSFRYANHSQRSKLYRFSLKVFKAWYCELLEVGSNTFWRRPSWIIKFDFFTSVVKPFTKKNHKKYNKLVNSILLIASFVELNSSECSFYSIKDNKLFKKTFIGDLTYLDLLS